MPDEPGGQFRRVKLRSPGAFVQGTFVTVVPEHSPSHRIIAGVLRGERHTAPDGPRKGQKRLTAQQVLHPVAEQGPCATCEVEQLNAKAARR